MYFFKISCFYAFKILEHLFFQFKCSLFNRREGAISDGYCYFIYNSDFSITIAYYFISNFVFYFFNLVGIGKISLGLSSF
jgi:hypothetical protein